MKNSQPPSGRRPAGSAGLLVAIFGFGFAIWYGWEWYRLPTWSEAEIEQSVELNLALDLARGGVAGSTDGEMRARREQIRNEVQREIAAERKSPRDRAAAGLLAGFLGLGQWILFRRLLG